MSRIKNIFALLILLLLHLLVFSQQASFKIAQLKYSGGGDWYANPSSLPDLIAFCNQNLKTNIEKTNATVEAGSPDIFNYPFVHMTGHGNVVFSAQDAMNLRKYLTSGGFLHIDDNYGMDKYIRNELKKIFPDIEMVEIPYNHPIYHQKYEFPDGLPKIHEHDGKPAQGFGFIYNGKLVCFYSYECDLGDGWEDPSIHKDPEETRQKALKMGANLVEYAVSY